MHRFVTLLTKEIGLNIPHMCGADDAHLMVAPIGVQTLRNIKRDYEAESLTWQTKWRYVIFVILFVLLIVLSLLAGSLGIGFVAPRVTSFFVILLWIFTIITMVVGAGASYLL